MGMTEYNKTHTGIWASTRLKGNNTKCLTTKRFMGFLMPTITSLEVQFRQVRLTHWLNITSSKEEIPSPTIMIGSSSYVLSTATNTYSNIVSTATERQRKLKTTIRDVFSNRVIDNWNLLPASCINCSTINTFKKHLSSELESEAVKFKVGQLW